MKGYWKKGFAAMAAVSMLLASLSGCGTSGNNAAGETKKETQTVAGGETSLTEESTNTANSVIDFEAEPYEVVMEVLTLGQEHPDIPEIEAAINEISLPAINCTIKLQTQHIGDHATKLSLAAAGGDKFDLVYTGTTTSLSTLVTDGVLLPMTEEMLTAHAPGYLEKIGGLIEACKVNGEVYTLPADLYPAAGGALIYNKDMADEFGITMPEKLTGGWKELEPVAEKLKEQGVYLVTAGNGAQGMMVTYAGGEPVIDFGGDFNYGVLIGETSTTIENMYESDMFKEYCHLIKEWRDKGYIPSDSMTSGENAQDTFKVGKSFLQGIKYTPAERSKNQNSYTFATEYAITSDPRITTEFVTQYAWGLCITSEQPERALDMLNLIYTNAEVGNLLMFGIEGKEYVKVSEHIVEMPEGVDASNIGYSVNFLRAGDAMDMLQWAPNTEDFYTELPAYQESAGTSQVLGYTFNTSEVSTQVANVTNVIAEYRPSLLCGAVEDVDASIAQLNEKLMEAGYQDIIEENQKQLDAWLENNK